MEAFWVFDANGNGHITAEELRAVRVANTCRTAGLHLHVRSRSRAKRKEREEGEERPKGDATARKRRMGVVTWGRDPCGSRPRVPLGPVTDWESFFI